VNSSIFSARRAALALLLAAAATAASACGDDGGDDDAPKGDGSVGDAASDGAMGDGGVPDDGAVPSDGGNIDGGGGDVDAHVAIDSSIPTDARTTDASADEIALALDRTGVRLDARRVDIVFTLSCRNLSDCDPEENEQECVDDLRADYATGVAAAYSDACLDATLDLFACFASVSCSAFETCEPTLDTQQALCPARGDGGSQ